MFKFTSSRSGNEREVELNVQALMQARFDGESWMELCKASNAEELAIRTERFGADCKGATVTDVRKSPEWADAAEAFAVSGGHDVESIRKMMVHKVRGSNGSSQSGCASAPNVVLTMSTAEQVMRSEQRILLAKLTADHKTALAELEAEHVRALETLRIEQVAAIDAVRATQSAALDALKASEAEAAVGASQRQQAAAAEAAAAERQAAEAAIREREEAELKQMLADTDDPTRRAELERRLHDCRSAQLAA